MSNVSDVAYCAYCGTPVRDPAYLCKNCGNPVTGAPRRPPTQSQQVAVPKSSSNVALIVIGVVVGFFVLVAIIGIVAAIAIPNLLTATQRSKQKRTMADVRSLSTALEAYAVDHDEYPKASSVPELSATLSPTYIKQVPVKDGWAHDLKYQCWSDDSAETCKSYAIASAGKDGVFDHEDLRDYKDSPSSKANFNTDIVDQNGEFTSLPEGLNRY